MNGRGKRKMGKRKEGKKIENKENFHTKLKTARLPSPLLTIIFK